MRLSAFNVYVSDHPSPGETLIYNSFTGGFVPVDADTLRVFHKADSGTALTEDEQALIDPDYFDENVGVLVESRAAEERAFRSWYEQMRSSTAEMQVIVSTTFACNLDCTYCIQADVLDGKAMPTGTAQQTAVWLAERAIEIGARKLNVVFTGGEPLLHPGRVEHIVNAVRARLAPAGIAFEFSLITNGVLLTRELVAKWKPLGLMAAQVTLDGDETTHSITRRSKKRGEDSFAAIFENVIAASQLIRINITGNYQTDTAHGFGPLITKLREAGLPRGSFLRFAPALAALGAPIESGSGACTIGGSSPELMLAFTDEILRAGFNPGIDSLYTVGPCGFHLRHHYSVDRDGNIYKCPGFLGKIEWAIGHVATGLTARYDGLTNLHPHRACGSCAHRPSCAGGCVAAEYVKKGIVEGVNCEIAYFEGQKDELVKRKYALATSETAEDALALFPARLVERIPASPVARTVGRVTLRVLAA